MGHNQHEQSSSSGAVVVVVAVVMLVAILGVVAIAGAGLLLFLGNTRSNVSRSVAIGERNGAIVVQKRAEEAAFQVRVREQQQQRQVRIANEVQVSSLADEPGQEPTLVVTLDREGNVAIDGERLDVAELRARLTRFKDATSNALSVQINVDRECLFEKLAPVFAACHELGGVEVRLAPSSGSEPEPQESDADN